MIWTIRTRKGNSYCIRLTWLAIPALVFVAALIMTAILSAYQAQYKRYYDATYQAILVGEAEFETPNKKVAQYAVRNCAYSTPEIFTVDMIYYQEREDGTTYYFTYNAYANGYQDNLARFNRYVDDIVDSAPSFDREVDKVKWIHDYIIQHFDYGGDHSALSMLDTGKGLCSAYTGLFEAMAKRMGVTCGTAVSDKMDHTWNIVKIGRTWYHVDATWDDKGDDVDYTYYMKTDEEFLQLQHQDWVDTSINMDYYVSLRNQVLIAGAALTAILVLVIFAPALFNYLFR